MEKAELLENILDAYIYPIVFVDTEFTIGYLNKAAKERYHQTDENNSLIGQSLFHCHQPASQEKIKALVKKIAIEKKEIFMRVNAKNEKLYITPVLDKNGAFIGFFERFEINEKIEI